MSQPANPSTIRPSLRAVALYEDAAANEQAGTILRVVEMMFREVADLCVKRWSFSHLERLDVRAMASHHGKDATILIVCSSTENSLPESVSTWMERTYQSPRCLKPLIIRFQDGSVAREDFTHKLASRWRVPLASDFSLDTSSSWEALRDFVEQRLSTHAPEPDGELLDDGHTRRTPCARNPAPEPCPMDLATRDRAYELWVSAGRPDGRSTDFWHQARREIEEAHRATATPTTESSPFPQPQTNTHENTPATTSLRCMPAAELMLRIPGHLHARSSTALLQHLARIPQELLTLTSQSRRGTAPPAARLRPAGPAQKRRGMPAPANLSPHTSSTSMIIRLDWFGCEPTAAREQRIHKALETLQSVKHISRASVRVEQQTSHSPAYILTLMLTMPGPDVLAHGTGHTFEEALIKLEAAALKSLENRAHKARQLNGAVRGVKALHRG
jgi:hypothetical protein